MELLTRLGCLIFLIKAREKLSSFGKYQKIEVWWRLGHVMTKNLFGQTIPDKIYFCVLLTAMAKV